MSKKFTQNWFDNNINKWSHFLSDYKNKDNLNFLEIGSFEGRSTCWLLDNILTGKNNKIFCVDTFEGGYEHTNWIDFKSVYQTFKNNISEYGNKVLEKKGTSSYWLAHPDITDIQFDFIYIDGCHESKEVLEDAVLSFKVLKNGGKIIFDDYQWGDYKNNPTQTPKIAIDSFISCYRKKIEILDLAYQVIIKKIND